MSSKFESDSSDEYTASPSSRRPKRNISDITRGRRGRPRGNPKPLNAEQRRMRNAELERLRRHELSEAYKELNEFIIQTQASSREDNNCELSRKQLIKRTIKYIIIKKGQPVEEIKAENQRIQEMIRELERDKGEAT